MDKVSFIKLIDNTNNVLASDFEGVRMISSRYPFFMAARIQELLMLTRNTQEFNSKLSETAALVADRKNLHYLLNSRAVPLLNNVEDIRTEEVAGEPVLAESNSLENNISESDSGEEVIELSFFDETTESPENSENIVNFEIVSSNNDDDQISFLEITSSDKSDTLGNDSFHSKHSHKEDSFIDAQLYTLEIPGEFIDDGNYVSLMPGINIEEIVEKQPDELEVPEKEKEIQGKEPQSLIDSFIETNPRIEKPKPIDPNAEIEDISLSSLKEPEDVASEQLAIIYRSQGLYDKAIIIYEKLCLKFPEKRVYFAGQIESIRNQIKE